MSLDLSRVVTQISSMVTRLKSAREERSEHISRALEVLHAQTGKLEALQKKVAQSRSTWLVAEPVEPLDRKHAPVPPPPDFTILATDGSHIDVDRHHGIDCFLLNISSVMLHYGKYPDARLENDPRVYFDDADVVIASPDRMREVPVEGNLLGIKRSVEELGKLAQIAADLPAGSASVGLVDGSLILWNLAAYPDFVSEELLKRGYLHHLDELRKLGANRRLGVAGYISFPRGADVANLLRVAICPREAVDSDRCGECKTRECDGLAGVRDRDIFGRLLAPGERSAIFASRSKVLEEYGPHRVYFFYLRLEGEVARVEVPGWVAQDKTTLDMAHTLILDQCRRGQGYPVALSEAHEKAVVTGADRENFWRLVDEATVGEHMEVTGSGKSASKRTRSV